MKERLPVLVENRELPIDDFSKRALKKNSYGYVRSMYIISLIITIINIITVIRVYNKG